VVQLIGLRPETPTFALERSLLSRWESERQAEARHEPRLDYLTRRLRALIDKQAHEANWVDRALADLSRAAGAPLPATLRSFGRRILEFPTHYTDLHSMAEVCGTSRGALKVRFRRRGLESPYTYPQMLAVAYMLSDRSVTVAASAHRLGFTSDGNLCRTMMSLTGLTPTEVRTVRGWNRLLINFAWNYLTAPALATWDGFDELFEHEVA